MWYQYQIVNRFSKSIVVESFEEFDEPEIAKEAAIITLNIKKLNDKFHTINIIPAKEFFESRLKGLMVKFNVQEASELAIRIHEYTHVGGILNNTEKHLFSNIESRLVGVDNYYYENDYS